MKHLPKILVIYSAILSTIIFTIGLVTSRSNEGLLFQLLILPIVGYLIYKAVKIKASEMKPNPTLITLAMVVFILLFGVSVINILNNDSDKQTVSNPKSITTFSVDENSNLEESDLPKYIFIDLSNADSFVNIKAAPDVNSSVIGQGINGERFNLIEELDEWYKVETKEQEGYINKDYAVKN